MRSYIFLTGLGFLTVFLSGCVDNYESVSVQALAGGVGLTDAGCLLQNKKGTWFVKTPGSVSVHLGSEDLSVECKKDGYIPAYEMVKSSVNFEAILLNGAIESTVSGSAWTYPQMITIPMQPATVIPESTVNDAPFVGN
jgi:hypothetical protein